MNTLRSVIKENDIIIAPGAYDVVSAEIIEKEGFDVVYISGLGVEASDIGRPDIGLTTETEITRRASKLFGVNVKLVKIVAYVMGSALASLGGVILASRLNSGQPAAGENFLFMAITATILGGTSLTGGEGTLVGTLLGAVILGLLSNILTLKNVSYFYQLVVQGLVLMAAVILDVMLVKKTS